MIKLNGSEKQIKWANDIRGTAWKSFKEAIKKNYKIGIRKGIDINIVKKATKDQLLIARKAFQSESSAVFYIENNELYWNKLISLMIKN